MPVGGEWRGLLFDNLRTGKTLSLSWTFTFEYEPVRRDYGETAPALEVDWVPLGQCSWSNMVGQQAKARRFSKPIETSAYFFEHHRFDQIEVRILEQRGSEIRVTAAASGDIDGLGLDLLEADRWLQFRGIHVQPSVQPRDVDDALRLLAEFTDVTGLVGVSSENNYLFRPIEQGTNRG